MKSYTPKQIVDLLIKNGFKFVRAKESHQIFINNETGLRTIVQCIIKI